MACIHMHYDYLQIMQYNYTTMHLSKMIRIVQVGVDSNEKKLLYKNAMPVEVS